MSSKRFSNLSGFLLVFSQNKTSSSNIGIPDYSKAIYINWYGYTYYDSLPNKVYLNKGQSTYVIPNNGWIIWTLKSIKYDDSPSSVTIRYFINGTKIYGDTPIPVRKGDVISAYNPYYKNATEAAMEFAPNT